MMHYHGLANMSSFSINASVSIPNSETYSNIKINAALNSRILNLSFGFNDLIIDLDFENAFLSAKKKLDSIVNSKYLYYNLK